MHLYREGVSPSSADYGFLCFFRIAEGIVELRQKKVMEAEDKSKKQVARPGLFSLDKVVDGKAASSLCTASGFFTPGSLVRGNFVPP